MRSTSLEVIHHLGWFNAISFFFSFQIEGGPHKICLTFVKNILWDNGLQFRKVRKTQSLETGWSFFAKGGEGSGV
jgi:hypothetical protein